MADRLHERSPWRIAYEKLVESLSTSQEAVGGRETAGATVSLTRNAKGLTQIEVTVRDESATEARITAQTIYDSLRVDFPLPHGAEGIEKPRKGGKLPADGIGPTEDIPL